MATIAPAPTYARTETYEHTGIWSWVTTVDHKRIGTLYLFTALFFFVVGGIEASLLRQQLIKPNNDFLGAETFNQLFTMHGTTMIFLVIMPLSAAFFNFLIPLQIGARDVAFPRLNAFSYWVYLLGGLFIETPILFHVAPDGGWFGYAPLTTIAWSPGLNIDFWVMGLQILGISSLAAAFNFITTIINMRAPGMNLMRMPMFTWMAFVVQFLLILAFPVITIALVFLLFDRFFGTNFYTVQAGADPLLWQHLFWIFGHPEVYILILPAFGLVSEVIPVYSRKPLFGYPVMVYSGILIGFLGFGVWAHHMFAVGMGPVADTVFSLTTMLIAIPTGVKIFNWLATMYGGSLRFTTQMLFAIALVGMFTIGGISGIMHSSPPADLQQTDTYFIVAHFHYVLFGGSIMGIFAGIYHYFPKITGRFLDDGLGKWHFWLNFVGFNLTFFPMHFAGMLGMPRRIYTYDAGQGWETFNLLSTLGTYVLIVASALFFVNMFLSLRKPATAPNDPWGSPTLEWSIPSPPPEYNFAELPRVTSRYPLWDVTAPGLTAGVPHTVRGDEAIEVHAAGKGHKVLEHAAPTDHPVPTTEPVAPLTRPAGTPLEPGAGRPGRAAPVGAPVAVAPAAAPRPARVPTARELGIPMPIPTAKPAFAALAIVIMFSGLLFLHADKKPVALGIIFAGAAFLVAMLYNWLLSPLEEEH